MDKLRVAVYIDFVFDKHIGGGLTYFTHMVYRINEHVFDERIDVMFLDKGENDARKFKKKLLQIPYKSIAAQRETRKVKLSRFILSRTPLKYFDFLKRLNARVEKGIQRDITQFLFINKIDFIYYLFPMYNPFLYPFVATHYDVGYKSTWTVKAPYSNKHFEGVKKFYGETLAKSLAIIVESKASIDELMYYENFNPDKLFVLPLIPSIVVTLSLTDKQQQKVLAKYKLSKNEFFVYPAQFWPHKNHFGLVHGFSHLVKEYPNLKLVLTGSDKGNFNYIKEVVANLGITERVVFAGYVDDEELYAFYKNAAGLVMPSLMGPTNMPPLEAAILGCKVACSDLKGHREQLGDYATYFNPNSIEDMYRALKELLSKPTETFHYQDVQPEITLNEIFKKLYVPAKISGYELPANV